MLMTPAWLIRLYLAAAMTLTSRADEDEECAVDERRLEYRVGEGGTVINSTDSIFTPNDCWRECCILRNRGGDCYFENLISSAVKIPNFTKFQCLPYNFH